MRGSEIERKTTETEITLRLALDGRGERAIDTGIGFLDHMLEQLAVHGLLDIQLRARGDLQVDVHHTVEDCAIVLGQAIDRALDDRTGITRIGASTVPMDEALASVAVDLSGRPYAVIDIESHGPAVGGIPTSLWVHFLETMAVHARCTLHARVWYGRDGHHQVEALFKALGRALDEATRFDTRREGRVPSSKGRLT